MTENNTALDLEREIYTAIETFNDGFFGETPPWNWYVEEDFDTSECSWPIIEQVHGATQHLLAYWGVLDRETGKQIGPLQPYNFKTVLFGLIRSGFQHGLDPYSFARLADTRPLKDSPLLPLGPNDKPYGIDIPTDRITYLTYGMTIAGILRKMGCSVMYPVMFPEYEAGRERSWPSGPPVIGEALNETLTVIIAEGVWRILNDLLEYSSLELGDRDLSEHPDRHLFLGGIGDTRPRREW